MDIRILSQRWIGWRVQSRCLADGCMACPVRCLVRGPRSTSLTRPLILTDSSSASPLDLHLPTTITSSHPPGRGPRPRQRQRGYAGRRRQAAKDPGRRIRPDAHLDRREGEGDRFGAAAGGLSRGRRVLHHLQHHGRVGTRIPMPGDPPPGTVLQPAWTLPSSGYRDTASASSMGKSRDRTS